MSEEQEKLVKSRINNNKNKNMKNMEHSLHLLFVISGDVLMFMLFLYINCAKVQKLNICFPAKLCQPI